MVDFQRIRRIAEKVGEARRRRYTRRVVQSLPSSIRKDIGWTE